MQRLRDCDEVDCIRVDPAILRRCNSILNAWMWCSIRDLSFARIRRDDMLELSG